MALIRWEPVAELGTIQNEMNRLFNNLVDQPNPTGRNGAAGRRWIPAMDLVETGDHYVLRAFFPASTTRTSTSSSRTTCSRSPGSGCGRSSSALWASSAPAPRAASATDRSHRAWGVDGRADRAYLQG